MGKITSKYVVRKEYQPGESEWLCSDCGKQSSSQNSGAAAGGGHSHCRSTGHRVRARALIVTDYIGEERKNDPLGEPRGAKELSTPE